MTADQRNRLRTLQHDAASLSLELRTDRGAAVGDDKTRLRAVGRLVEQAAHTLIRASERAAK